MNAALGNAMSVTPQANDTNARLRSKAAADATDFREALNDKGKAGAEPLPEMPVEPQAKKPGLTPIRWSLPHAAHQATGKTPTEGHAEDEGEGVKDEADTGAPTAELTDSERPLPQADGGSPAEKPPADEPRAEQPPAPTIQAAGEPPTMDGDALLVAADLENPPSAATQMAQAPGQPAVPANERARQTAATASPLNRQNIEPPASTPTSSQTRAETLAETRVEPRAESFRERNADVSGKAEIAANATRPASTAQEGSPRDGQAEIRVLSIQRAPAPVAPGQRSATAETAQTQLQTHSEGGRVLQTLKIQLHPAELGPVTARLRIVADQLMVDIQVETAEARNRLGSDSDAIVKALRGLGYDIDRVTVQQAAPGAPSNGATAGNARDGAFQPTGDRGDGDQSSSTGQGERQDHPGRNRGPSQDNDDAPGSGLYI